MGVGKYIVSYRSQEFLAEGDRNELSLNSNADRRVVKYYTTSTFEKYHYQPESNKNVLHDIKLPTSRGQIVKTDISSNPSRTDSNNQE